MSFSSESANAGAFQDEPDVQVRIQPVMRRLKNSLAAMKVIEDRQKSQLSPDKRRRRRQHRERDTNSISTSDVVLGQEDSCYSGSAAASTVNEPHPSSPRDLRVIQTCQSDVSTLSAGTSADEPEFKFKSRQLMKRSMGMLKRKLQKLKSMEAALAESQQRHNELQIFMKVTQARALKVAEEMHDDDEINETGPVSSDDSNTEPVRVSHQACQTDGETDGDGKRADQDQKAMHALHSHRQQQQINDLQNQVKKVEKERAELLQDVQELQAKLQRQALKCDDLECDLEQLTEIYNGVLVHVAKLECQQRQDASTADTCSTSTVPSIVGAKTKKRETVSRIPASPQPNTVAEEGGVSYQEPISPLSEQEDFFDEDIHAVSQGHDEVCPKNHQQTIRQLLTELASADQSNQVLLEDNSELSRVVRLLLDENAEQAAHIQELEGAMGHDKVATVTREENKEDEVLVEKSDLDSISDADTDLTVPLPSVGCDSLSSVKLTMQQRALAGSSLKQIQADDPMLPKQ